MAEPRETFTSQDVLNYIADCAESVIEDDLNECGTYTDETFERFQVEAYRVLDQLRG